MERGAPPERAAARERVLRTCAAGPCAEREESARELTPDEVAHQRDALLRVGAGLLDEAMASAREVRALDRASGRLIRAHQRIRDRGVNVGVELGLGHPDGRQRAVLA